jgi:Lysozyme inhibitor LprI
MFAGGRLRMRLLPAVPLPLLLFGLAVSAMGAEWPSGFVVHSGTESPDGRYGILVPPQESESNKNGDCYLADIQSHRVLGKLKAVDYFEHQNHADLSAIWNGDRCLVTREGRFGFDTISLIELHGQEFHEVDLGTAIEHSLDTVTAKEAAKDQVENPGGPATAYVRFGGDDRIRFRAVSTSNPKQLEGVHTYCALFQGTYDPGAARWTVTDARPITGAMFDTLSDAYVNAGDDTTQFSTEQAKADAYDQKLNEVYSALRFILPKTEFEKVKEAQVAWLKQRDAAPSIEEKNRRVLARIKALQERLW